MRKPRSWCFLRLNYTLLTRKEAKIGKAKLSRPYANAPTKEENEKAAYIWACLGVWLAYPCQSAIRMMSTDEFGGNQLKLQATKNAHTPKRNEETTKIENGT